MSSKYNVAKLLERTVDHLVFKALNQGDTDYERKKHLQDIFEKKWSSTDPFREKLVNRDDSDQINYLFFKKYDVVGTTYWINLSYVNEKYGITLNNTNDRDFWMLYDFKDYSEIESKISECKKFITDQPVFPEKLKIWRPPSSLLPQLPSANNDPTNP